MRILGIIAAAWLLAAAAGAQQLNKQVTAPMRSVGRPVAPLVALPKLRTLPLPAPQRTLFAKQLTGNPQTDASAPPLRYAVDAGAEDPELFLYDPGIVSTASSSAKMLRGSAAGFRLRAPGTPPLAGAVLFVCDVAVKGELRWSAYPRQAGADGVLVGGPVQQAAGRAMFVVDLAMVDDAMPVSLQADAATWTFNSCDATMLR